MGFAWPDGRGRDAGGRDAEVGSFAATKGSVVLPGPPVALPEAEELVMLPEGNINYRFHQIPQLARDGLKYGVAALQIAGWQRGGHDNGYPYYEPDPRLGTWAELEEAIRQCHAMGVRV